MNIGGKCKLGIVVTVLLLTGACSSDDSDQTTDIESEVDPEAPAADDGGLQNSCPADGCQIDFASIEADGEELKVSWEINFAPDISNNHIHIYWDMFSAAQVSNDATERGVEQGEWVPTDATPEYTTDGAVSTSERGESTTLCLVAADRDHNVIDEGTQVCRDVSEFLS